MCNCLKELEKKMVGTDIKGKKVVKAEVISAAIFPFNTVQAHQTISEMELIVDGRKGKVKQNVTHTFCPFCGVAYPKGK